MLNRTLSWLVAAMVVVTLLGVGLRTPNGQKPAVRPEVGYLAPDFTLQDMDGNPVTLSSLTGKVVFLNFWASWCAPCRIEMPEMERLHAQQIPDLVILAINQSTTERQEDDGRRFMAAYGYTFPALFDQTGRVGNNYLAVSMPTSYFIGPDGIVRAKHLGPMTLSTMNNYVKWAREAD